MNSEWKTFLEDAGAVIENGGVRHFGDSAQELQAANRENVLADLSHLGLIKVSGADAATFLQSQFTNDVREVSEQRSQLSAYCSPKGRMLACFRLFMRDGAYYLRLPLEIVEPTLKRLRMFVLRAKVTLEDASDTLIRIGLAGPDAAKILSGAPESVDGVGNATGSTIIRVPGAQPRFEIIGPVDTIKEIWATLHPHVTPVGANVWDLLDIRAGIPTVHTATADTFVPQMVNLDTLGGVSFTKGCYPGQEIVARVHYLGTIKRRMYLAHIATNATPHPGDAVHAAGNTGKQGVGTIVTAQPSPAGGFEALAIIEVNAAEDRGTHLYTVSGTPFTFLDLPRASTAMSHP
ncbi:MAG: folate-binding protein YgfZ [Gammaproteobacteria bacterium]|nr:folate-binding protein YgfZ [Gammaproteobacteria bacterium]